MSTWGTLWRVLAMLVVAPILWVFGLALLVLALGAFVVPPVYVLFAFYTGDWILGISALIPWCVLLRFRRPIWRWLLQGEEYASI